MTHNESNPSRKILKAEKWVNGGYTISHSLDKPVFLSGAIPGETVEAELLKETETHSFYQARQVIESSPDRIASDCKIFGDCGGCNFRHISYEDELSIKKSLLADLLQEKEDSIQAIWSEPNHYRNNVQYHVKDNKIGFYSKFSRNIIDMRKIECKNLPIELQVSSILKDNSKKSTSKNKAEVSIDLSKPQSIFRRLQDGNEIVDYEKDNTLLHIFGQSVRIPSGGFSQINRFLLESWLKTIQKLLPANSSKLGVVELFCGAGTISLAIASQVKSLIGYESFPKAIPYARKNAKFHNHQHLQFEVKDLYKDLLPKDQVQGKDLWIVNPPRKGLTQKITSQIIQFSPPTILYSSCDPNTLTRDLIQLSKGGYERYETYLFDFFPRTSHYEVLVKLEKTI